MIRRLYNWTMSLAGHRNATGALALVSFTESSVFPIPPDVLLIPMVLARRARAWLYATVCSVSSVLGGIFGYIIGYFLMDAIGWRIISIYGYTRQFEQFADLYNEWGFWIVLTVGVTPLPYKVVTIASGATGMNLIVFALASLVGRAMRFYAVAGLLYWFGPPMKAFIERYLNWLFWLFILLLIGGFIIITYI